jgi:hypothetical protein
MKILFRLAPPLLGVLISATAALAQTSPGVGVGTTSPQAPLHVEARGAGPLLLLRNPGSVGAAASLDFQTYDPGANASGARLQALDNNFSADLVFLTKAPGASANPLVERLRISSTGVAVATGVTTLAVAAAGVAPTAAATLAPAASTVVYADNGTAAANGPVTLTAGAEGQLLVVVNNDAQYLPLACASGTSNLLPGFAARFVYAAGQWRRES